MRPDAPAARPSPGTPTSTLAWPEALGRARALSRADKWWASKVAPLLAAAYLALLIEPRPVAPAAGRAAAMVVSASLLASAAYVINDWFDREVDRAVGKTSVTMGLRAPVVGALWVGLVVLGLAIWLVVPVPAVAWGALAVIVMAPLAYSAPPLRWKERGGLGLLADAGLAHVAPTTFALAAFGAFDHLDELAPALAVGATIAWSAVAGLRRIIGHELVDVALDRAAGVETWVDRVGEARARRSVERVVLPLEIASLAVVVLALVRIAPGAAVAFVAIAAGMAYARAIGAWRAPLPAVPTDEDERAVLYLFLRFWPAVVLASALAVRDPAYFGLLVAHLLLFWPVAVGELTGLAVAGGEALRLTWAAVAGWLRYSAWEWVAHSVPNWFRHTAWPPVAGWFRYSAWEWVAHSVPNWFRHRLWPWVAHSVPNWFRYRAWVWASHTAPNWFRYRLPVHVAAARGRVAAGTRRGRSGLRRAVGRAVRPLRSRTATPDQESSQREA